MAGLATGNQGRAHGLSDITRDHLDKFWALIDEILNAVLFVLLGFEVIRVTLTRDTILAGALVIPIVLVARSCSVALPIAALARWAKFQPGTIRVLTWGGPRDDELLRGRVLGPDPGPHPGPFCAAIRR